MSETYYIAVCSSGISANLKECIESLIKVKDSFTQSVEIILILNHGKKEMTFNDKIQLAFEPERGYSNVRNKALSLIPEGTNLIFIDDDEYASPEWLHALIKMHLKFPRDIIAGPVYSIHSQQNISFRAQRSKDAAITADESIILQAGAGNMLIPKEVLDSGLVHFDKHFNLSGSEDTDLCFRLRKNGINIRFAVKAIILENEDVHRYDPKYIENRKLKDIVNYSVVIRRNESLLGIVRRFSTLFARTVFYFAMGFVRRKHYSNAKIYGRSLIALITGHVII